MITSPISRPITSRIASAIAGAVAAAGRWYLHWGGVNQYAQHSPWSMSGFGDRIEFSFVADAVDVWHKINGTADQKNLIRITNTGVLQVSHLDIDGTTQRWISGPTCSVGTVYSGSVTFNADGVVLTVNGTEYTGGFVPYPLKNDYNSIAAIGTPTSYFKGTIHYLRYVNATALQGVNAVQSDGVNLTGTIPAITLTSATISFPLLYKSGNQTILTGSAAILTVSSDLFVKGANVTSLLVDGQEYASETLVDGQHYDIVIAVDGGTLTTIGQMVSGGVMGTLTVDDAVFDLSGDDGSTIPNTGVGSDGTWNNYDPGTDQVALPILSRRYEIKDGPDALFLEDANHPLGPELVVNGGFDTDANWSEIAGGSSNTISGGQLTSVISASFRGAYQPLALAAGTYVISFDLVASSAGTVQFVGKAVADGISGTTVFQLDAITPGTYSAVVTIVGGVNSIAVRNSASSATFTIDNVSVRCIETGAILYNVSESDWDRSKT